MKIFFLFKINSLYAVKSPLITRRSQVQILAPLPNQIKGLRPNAVAPFLLCRYRFNFSEMPGTARKSYRLPCFPLVKYPRSTRSNKSALAVARTMLWEFLWDSMVYAASGCLSLIHISEPTRLGMISYAV